MMVWSPKLKALVIVPILTGSISFISSITIITMILRSDLNIAKVYKRLVLGMSFFDLIQSLSMASSSLPMPAGMMFAAVGNDITCDLQAFTIVLGSNGTAFYNLSLSVYFILMVRFEMIGRDVMKCIEPLLHIIPIVVCLSGAIYLYVAGYYNPADDTFCWVAPQPLLDCIEDEESTIECVEKWDHLVMRAGIITGLPMVIVIVGNILTLAILWHVSYTYARRSRRRRPIMTQEQELQQSQDNDALPNNLSAATTSPPNRNPSTAQLPSPPQTSVRQKEIITRAVAYIAGFMLTHIFSLIFRNMQIRRDVPPPYILEFLSRTFFPLQGFSNLIIYSYPYVASYRRINQGLTWIQAFVEVIKTGVSCGSTTSGTSRRIRNGTHITEPDDSLFTGVSALQTQHDITEVGTA